MGVESVSPIHAEEATARGGTADEAPRKLSEWERNELRAEERARRFAEQKWTAIQQARENDAKLAKERTTKGPRSWFF